MKAQYSHTISCPRKHSRGSAMAPPAYVFALSSRLRLVRSLFTRRKPRAVPRAGDWRERVDKLKRRTSTRHGGQKRLYSTAGFQTKCCKFLRGRQFFVGEHRSHSRLSVTRKACESRNVLRILPRIMRVSTPCPVIEESNDDWIKLFPIISRSYQILLFL